MRHEVEIALRLLLRSDTSIPPNGCIDRAMEILKGETPQQPAVATQREVERVLHVTHAEVRELIRVGKLNRVIGVNNRCIGVSRESLRRYLKGEALAAVEDPSTSIDYLQAELDKELKG